MQKSIDFLALGELLADIVTADYVEKLSHAKTFQLHSGGSPANVCANLRWLGIDAALVSCIGQDSIGDFLLEELNYAGLDTSHIQRIRSHPTSIVLVARSKGTPDFVAYRSADTQLGQIDEQLLNKSRIVHTCAFALSRSPAQHHILQALSIAASKQKTISIDWNYAPSMWESEGSMVFQQVCSMHPLLKVSIDDVARFVGGLPDVERAKAYLQKIPAKVVCLTCGKDGVWYRDSNDPDWKFEPAEQVRDIKDTTGAGDAFWSGFISAWLKDYDLTRCVKEGIEVAGRKIRKFGPLYRS
jgi:sugar/nucleoside kinase (ribokinase family)